MYLKKLEVAGFKSFGSRTKLKFGQGVVAVVGPNGSGKSNIADSVRWVLGEQSAKLLRLKKSEELIFNGTESKPKSSLAEVSLLLDNSDEKMPIDFREVEITRRLYRSGESDYLLNGNKVRLIDIEDILARSGFGQHSYSVIGQGMIDNVILASPAERKLMFDEAAGIRVYELRREASIKKLDKAKFNLIRTGDIIKELEPRAQLLISQASQLSRLTSLKTELENARLAYLSSNIAEQELHILAIKKEKEDLSKRLASISAQLKQIHQLQQNREKASSRLNSKFAVLASELKKAELSRDQHFNSLVVAQAQLNVTREAAAGGVEVHQELKTLASEQKTAENLLLSLKKRHHKISQSVADIELQIKKFDSRLVELTSQLNLSRSKLAKGQKSEYLQHALGLVLMLGRNQKKPSLKPYQIDIVLHKLARMIKLATEDKTDELAREISRLQNLITKVMTRREEVSDKYTKEVLKQRSLELDINSVELQLEGLRSRADQLTSETPEQKAVASAIEKHSEKIASLQQKVDQLDSQIAGLREKIYVENKTQQGNDSANIEQAREAEKLSHDQATIQTKISQIDSEITLANEKNTELLAQGCKWFGDNFNLNDLKTTSSPVSASEIAKLTAEIEVIGELDPGLAKESVEEQTRLKFLIEQRNDLEQAIADLEKIVFGLEGLIHEKFEKAFTRINKNFGDYFTRLFGGGKASIKLKKDNLDQYGIEIKASPPGKKVELLTSLSGGERALAGMALLAAIITVNPSPFVILDEVDAALDDTNSLKFARILRELAAKSQVIVITHNHETMKIAHQLFGVSTDKSGDSVLFSVKLEKAHQLAETQP